MRTIYLPALFICLILFGSSIDGNAQALLHITQGCAYKTSTEDTDLYSFDASDEAVRIITEICNAVGVSQNFDIRASSVENALATTDGNRRIILYSTVFLKKFNEDARTRWAAYSVLAHEIGHHFNGHNFAETNLGKCKTMELEADKFSGSALRLLGASLDEAKAGLETFALEGEQAKHPSAKARREALATGWNQQQERLEKMGIGANTNPDTGAPRERDTDGDGIPDRNDACPEEYGRPLTAGCPDADEDGIPDRNDLCRYRKGPASWKGCPDSDSDGIPDHEDQCPDKAGLLADKGCPPPDRDNDGVIDRADKCPDVSGLARFQGCPDKDGDGVPDVDDKCPREYGDPIFDGCPKATATTTTTKPQNGKGEIVATSKNIDFRVGDRVAISSWAGVFKRTDTGYINDLEADKGITGIIVSKDQRYPSNVLTIMWDTQEFVDFKTKTKVQVQAFTASVNVDRLKLIGK